MRLDAKNRDLSTLPTGQDGKRAGALRLTPIMVGVGLCLLLALSAILLGGYAMQEIEPTAFDQFWAAKMKSLAKPASIQWMKWVTNLGDKNVLLIVGLAGAAWQLIKRQYWFVVAWFAIGFGGWGVNEGIKAVIARERPPQALRGPAVPAAKGFSFPSGHSMNSIIVYGLLGYFAFVQSKRRWQGWMIVVELIIIVGAIGFSRVFLRVHWASDVLAGFLIGGAWLALTLGFVETLRRGQLAKPQTT